MAYKQQTIGLIIRLALILAVMMCIPLATTYVESGQLFFTYLAVAMLLIALTSELIFFLNRINRELTRFLEHIRNREFKVRFNEDASKGARKKLYKSFNEVLQIYGDIRIEREMHFRFLEHIIELIEVGIIVFDSEGKVVLANTASENISGIPALRSWSHFMKKSPALCNAIGSIERSKQILFNTLAIQVSKTRMLTESYSLMTLQDVGGMVDQKETGAWIRLLRTLNHEIKNSVTPVCSLADTLMMILHNEQGQLKTLEELDSQNLSDINLAVETLQQRSNSLLSFIEAYQTLAKIPVPEPESLTCSSLLEDMRSLLASECMLAGIKLQIKPTERGLKIRADRGLIEQVLINLVRNSMEALMECRDPEILLSAEGSVDKISILVTDNGPGIEQSILEDVFVPFFSTKSKGSGIGLSLVRQVMRLHGGDVQIASSPTKGTQVCLTFHSSH
jgi:nitrogen fixation/metabolism regulation signal transduction histidine kinase